MGRLVDLALLVFLVVASVMLGFCLGYSNVQRAVYQACETRQPLVIEMGGVKQVYACLKVQR